MMLTCRATRSGLRPSLFRASTRNSLHNTPCVRLASTLPKLPIFEALASHDPESVAVAHSGSEGGYTYGQLLRDVALAKNNLRRSPGVVSEGQRIAFLVENSYDHVGRSKRQGLHSLLIHSQ